MEGLKPRLEFFFNVLQIVVDCSLLERSCGICSYISKYVSLMWANFRDHSLFLANLIFHIDFDPMSTKIHFQVPSPLFRALHVDISGSNYLKVR